MTSRRQQRRDDAVGGDVECVRFDWKTETRERGNARISATSTTTCDDDENDFRNENKTAKRTCTRITEPARSTVSYAPTAAANYVSGTSIFVEERCTSLITDFCAFSMIIC